MFLATIDHPTSAVDDRKDPPTDCCRDAML